MFAMARRIDQAPDEFLISVLVFIGDERGHFLRCGWQAGQVIANPPDQRPTIRHGRRSELLLRQLRADERIDRIHCTAGHRRPHQWRERPVGLSVLFPRELIRPARPRVDPGAQRRHLLRRQPRFVALLRRHQNLLVLAAHVADERTLLRLMRHNRHMTAVATLQRDVAQVEPVAALLLLRPVALVAVLLQNRPHIPREVRRGAQSCCGHQSRQSGDHDRALHRLNQGWLISRCAAVLHDTSWLIEFGQLFSSSLVPVAGIGREELIGICFLDVLRFKKNFFCRRFIEVIFCAFTDRCQALFSWLLQARVGFAERPLRGARKRSKTVLPATVARRRAHLRHFIRRTGLAHIRLFQNCSSRREEALIF